MKTWLHPRCSFSEAGARAEHFAELALAAPFELDPPEAVAVVERLCDRLRLALLAQVAASARTILDNRRHFPAPILAEHARAVRPIHRELSLRLADPEQRRAHAEAARLLDRFTPTRPADLEATR